MEITELQKDLAATFRWTARLNMHEGVANHFSACVPGSSTDFYVNKAGIHFSQIKASDLILVTKENINDLKNKPDLIDPTAINIHGTIHQKSSTRKMHFSRSFKICNSSINFKRSCHEANRSKYNDIL